MEIKADMIRFQSIDASEFNPAGSVDLRDEYREIWLKLQRSDRNVVIMGDPGTCRSMLLRFVFGCFAFGWAYDTNGRDTLSPSRYSGPWKAASTCILTGQWRHQGAMGQRESNEDK